MGNAWQQIQQSFNWGQQKKKTKAINYNLAARYQIYCSHCLYMSSLLCNGNEYCRLILSSEMYVKHLGLLQTLELKSWAGSLATSNVLLMINFTATADCIKLLLAQLVYTSLMYTDGRTYPTFTQRATWSTGRSSVLGWGRGKSFPLCPRAATNF